MKRTLGFTAMEFLIILLIIIVVGIVLFPVFAQPTHRVSSRCLSQLKMNATAAIIYSGDHSDTFSPADKWMDLTLPYTKNELTFHCPQVGPRQYGYAMNRFLGGAKAEELEQPSIAHLYYESKALERNASEYLPIFPMPGRHKGTYSVAFADGHVKVFPRKSD